MVQSQLYHRIVVNCYIDFSVPSVAVLEMLWSGLIFLDLRVAVKKPRWNWLSSPARNCLELLGIAWNRSELIGVADNFCVPFGATRDCYLLPCCLYVTVVFLPEFIYLLLFGIVVLPLLTVVDPIFIFVSRNWFLAGETICSFSQLFALLDIGTVQLLRLRTVQSLCLRTVFGVSHFLVELFWSLTFLLELVLSLSLRTVLVAGS